MGKSGKVRGGGTSTRSKYEGHVRPRLDFVTAAARMGNSEEEIARQLGVSYSTFREHKKKHEELRKALAQGAEDANAAVTNSLYKRALGYTVRVQKAFKLKKPVIVDGKRVADEEIVETAEEDLHVPADTKAIVFWLTNRLPAQWKSSPDANALEALRRPNRELLEALQKGIPELWTSLPEGCEAKEESPESEAAEKRGGE